MTFKQLFYDWDGLNVASFEAIMGGMVTHRSRRALPSGRIWWLLDWRAVGRKVVQNLSLTLFARHLR